MRSITVDISPDGTIDIDIDGIQGKGCKDYSKALIDALEAEVIEDEEKPDYYAQESVPDMV